MIRTFSSPARYAAMTLVLLPFAARAAESPAAAGVAPAIPKPATTRIIDTKAQEIYEKMRGVYKNLDSYSMTMLTKVTDPTGKASYSRTEFAFRKPNRFASKTTSKGGGYEIVSNGRIFYAREYSSPKQYFALPMPSEDLGPLGLMKYRAAGTIFTPLLADVDFFTAPWGAAPDSVTLGKPQVIAGEPADTVIFTLPSKGPKTTLTYSIDRKNSLLRRAEVKAEVGKQSYIIQESYTDIKRNPALRLETFTYVPPAGATQVGSGKEEVVWNPDLKVGSPAPTFEIPGLDGKPIKLDEYKGKVVLLDFWATWCGPCVEELPFTKAVYEKYHAQGLEIVGISFDEESASVQAFLKAFDIPWRQGFDGKSYNGEINKEYKLSALPFMLLIGRDGKIAAINPRTLALEPAIKKALAQPQ